MIYSTFVAFDLETTGLFSNKDEIVEIGAVIGTYIGPGGIALVYEEKEARW